MSPLSLHRCEDSPSLEGVIVKSMFDLPVIVPMLSQCVNRSIDTCTTSSARAHKKHKRPPRVLTERGVPFFQTNLFVLNLLLHKQNVNCLCVIGTSQNRWYIVAGLLRSLVSVAPDICGTIRKVRESRYLRFPANLPYLWLYPSRQVTNRSLFAFARNAIHNTWFPVRWCHLETSGSLVGRQYRGLGLREPAQA